MSELLRRVAVVKTSRRLGSVFLNHRELSAQEAVYRILSLPLKMLSRKVVFVNTSPKQERVSLLKHADQLANLETDSEDIYQTSLIDRYAARPDSLNNICLAEFAANYTTRTGADPEEGESNDALPTPEPESTERCPRIQLKNGLGYMYKRPQHIKGLSLTQDKLNTLRMKLSNLQLVIIDEVSMVGSNMLLQVHKRLQQLKGSKDDTSFGNVSILAVGQLQPVAQPHVFEEVSDMYARLHRSGSLWTDEFFMVELDENMRQRGDQRFAELLCRVRKANHTEEDLDLLRSRAVEDDDPDYPHDAVHV